jgi:putative restriction endonuclease
LSAADFSPDSSSSRQSCWEAFREANEVSSLEEMRARIAFYRRTPILATENPTVGCILLAEPFFWSEDLWISAPLDFKSQTVQGRGYEAAAK